MLLRPSLGALVALLALLVPVAPAAAVPDGPLDVYLEHIQPLSLDWPADGTLTDGYGPRWGRMHLGLDVGILRSLDVRAAAGGTVTAAGWLTGYEGYGNVVTVDIGSGYTLLYAHLSVAQVVPGQWLACGRPDRPGRLHRLLHGHAPPPRAAQERRAGRSRSVPPLDPGSPPSE